MAMGILPYAAAARRTCRIRNEYVKEALSEFFGTFILVLFVLGANFQTAVMSFENPGHPPSFLQPVLGAVGGLTLALLICGGISSHVNPAVTLGLAVAGHCSWIKVPLFFFVQLLGAYLASGLSYGIYKYSLEHQYREISGSRDDIPGSLVAGLFAPVPQEVPIGIGILDQVVGTAMLFITIVAVVDRRNMRVPRSLLPIYVGIAILAIACAFGYNAGASLNPARDLGPRLMFVTVGFNGTDIFQTTLSHGVQEWWIVGFFGPLLGGIVGAVIYIHTIGSHTDDAEDEEDPEAGGEGAPDAADWRSTVYIPKANPMPMPIGSTPTSPVSQYPPNSNGSYSNNGYNRRESERRQY